MQTETLPSTGSSSLIVRHWRCEDPVARVQILHGMAEHCERYAAFAEFLQAHQIEVIAHNHLGHGERAPLGYFAEEDGWRKVLDDVSQAQFVGNQQVPLFLLGHSMGSFIARHWAALHGNKLAGLILCGSNHQHPALFWAALAVAKTLGKIQGQEHPSKIMDFLSFGAFNSHFKPNRTEFDWLCSDNSVVDAYIEDPLCGNLSSLKFWQDFMGGLSYVCSDAGIQALPQNLPIQIIGGDKDPVGRMGKGLVALEQVFKTTGHKNVQLKLYANGRHEILNEVNKEEVWGDALGFVLATKSTKGS